jgi:hypothetical protein
MNTFAGTFVTVVIMVVLMSGCARTTSNNEGSSAVSTGSQPAIPESAVLKYGAMLIYTRLNEIIVATPESTMTLKNPRSASLSIAQSMMVSDRHRPATEALALTLIGEAVVIGIANERIAGRAVSPVGYALLGDALDGSCVFEGSANVSSSARIKVGFRADDLDLIRRAVEAPPSP